MSNIPFKLFWSTECIFNVLEKYILNNNRSCESGSPKNIIVIFLIVPIIEKTNQDFI